MTGLPTPQPWLFLRLLSNTVVLSACVAYSSIGIFRCDFVPFEFSSVSHSEMRLLLSTCASFYCSHAKQIKEDLNDIQ